MKAFHLPLFVWNGQACQFQGECLGDEWLDGTLEAGGQEAGIVRKGVAIFASANDVENAWIEDIRQGGWIAYNWQNEYERSQRPPDARLCDLLAATEGPILEIAAGPGGGNLAPVLRRAPGASIIVNDIAAPVLELWRAYLAPQDLGPRVSFAAFDACAMPLRDGSIHAVSSSGGLGEIGGHLMGAREAARVLAPGGRLYTAEILIEPDGWSRLPSEMRHEHETRNPGLTRGWASVLEEVGLRIESREVIPGRALDPNEGGLPNEAARHGVTLRVQYEYTIAVKP